MLERIAGNEELKSSIRRMLEGLTQEELGVHTHCLETIAANAKNMLEEKNHT